MKKTIFDKTAKPLAQETRRHGQIHELPASSATGTGSGYKNHVPLTIQLRLNDTTTSSLSSLIDTGASLSIIDANLLEKLGGEPQGEGMMVHGLGDMRTLGWTTITIFIEARDPKGNTLHLECRQDFHVLPLFSPGLCLGLDFISTHNVSLSSGRGKASIGRYVFPVVEQVSGPYSRKPEIHAAEDVELPPGQYTWVPVYAGCLAPGVDYTVHPRMSVTEDETIQLAGPTGYFTHRPRHHILLANFGTRTYAMEKGTVVADALSARLGDLAKDGGQMFELGTACPSSTPSSNVYTSSSAADPVNPFEDDGDDTVLSSLARDAETVLVDDHFRIGVDASGSPPAEIVEVLRSHTDAFALDGRPGRIHDGEEMGIELVPDAVLRPEAPRRASPEKRKAMDSAIDQLLEWDVIEPSNSPISFPVLMVKQRDKWRFCVDYRQLNLSTVADRYPLPTIDSIFNTLVGKKMFSSLDAIRGYHQMGVKETDRWKTAFVCHRGLFQYRTVPFGLRNAPSVFQRLMDRILGSLRWQQAVVYIDDIVVATHTLDEHVRALDTLLSRASSAGLKFSPSKCTFAVPSLVLLGRKVSGAGVAVWEERARAVSALSRPTTLRELYHVLGLFGYYRAFIHRYAAIAAPLTSLTRGWRYEADAAGRYRLIDAEGKAVAAERVPLAWGADQQQSFETLKHAVANPPVLAHPDPVRPFVLYVDASKDAFAAILHQVFDQPLQDQSQSFAATAAYPADVPLLPPTVARERWLAWLRSDRYFAPILRRLERGERDDVWTLREGLPVRRIDDRLALPESAVPVVMRSVHDRGGHFGFLRTYLAVSRNYWRPRLSVAVRSWVRHCVVCLQTKRLPKAGELNIDHDPQFPFEWISVDLLLGLPNTRSGNDAVLVMLDVFSRMVLLQPCPSSITAEGIAAIISDRILRLGWKPRRFVSDSEARVSGAVMSTLAASLNAELAPSPPHHQQANAVERAIQTVQHVLQALGVAGQAHWDRRLVPTVELAINSTPSSVSGFRPFDLVFVYHPEAAHVVFDAGDHAGVSSFPERLAAAEERIHDARLAIDASRLTQKQRYDRRRRALPDLREGDQVYVRLGDRPMPGLIRSKLDARKAGPYAVRTVLSPHRVLLDLPADVNVGPEFSIEQLDLLPRSPDPFHTHRSGGPSVTSPPSASEERPVELPAATMSGDDGSAEALEHIDAVDGRYVPDDVVLPPRARRPPDSLRHFEVGTIAAVDADGLREALRGPIYRRRVMEVDGVSLELRERPVAFLSRLTSVTEQKMAASELELCCLAWAFARLAHLLEGAELTVVTDHAPLGAMLTSTSAIPYGPTISRCRALLMPHVPNMRFVHRAGSTHTNADALSRLPPAA
ncbi:hypothetical protein CF326_g6948 [Tilletia indica]|nr:hypothetical protein CF326_g6948 [Tilletia indica]